MSGFRGIGGTGKEIETALLAFFFRELEGTMEEFYASFRKIEVTPRQRTEFERAIQRLQRKQIIEAIGYSGRYKNYRVSETVLERGLITRRRGSYGIEGSDQCDGHRVESRRARREASRFRG